MIDVNKAKVQEVIKEIHESMLRKGKRIGHENETIIMENRLFLVICEDYTCKPYVLAQKMNDKYGYELTKYDILQILRTRKLNSQDVRSKVFGWAKEVTDLFPEAISGNKQVYEEYEKKRKEAALDNNEKHEMQERAALFMLYERYPEIDQNSDLQRIESFGNTLARFFYYDISDAIGLVYHFNSYFKPKSKEKKMTYEQAIARVEQLESILERTNTMLSDLQDEFDGQLEESKAKEYTEFFSKLNSDKYGCILDELLVLRKGADQLRKSNYELPLEINGLLIMTKKLIQFIRDSHIEPIMRVNSVQEVRAKDIEFCIYEGSPFKNNKQVKKVRVISSGWVYKDKDIQISRPKVKEER